MTSNNIQVEPYVLKYLRQIEDPVSSLACRPVDPESHSSPTLRRKLSEPLHKTSVPLKPILKSKRCMSGGLSPNIRTFPHQVLLRPVKNSIPLGFSSRKPPPPVDPSNTEEMPGSAVSSDSDTELFYTPGSVRSDLGSDNGKEKTLETGKDYLSARQESKDHPESDLDNYYADPPTPFPTPALRSSFSQPVPFQGYPPTRSNTVRHKRRTPPIVDELDRQRNSAAFPTRQSFTFSALPTTPSPSEFPLPPANNVPTGQPSRMAAITPPRRVSWRPSFTRRAQDKTSSQRQERVRVASKRKSVSDSQSSTKRRKVVHFAPPQGRKEHPPMRRRPTPYYEPFSSKLRRTLRRLFSRFLKSEEEKEQEEEAKLMKKAAKKARKEREEDEYCFRNFDDTVD